MRNLIYQPLVLLCFSTLLSFGSLPPCHALSAPSNIRSCNCDSTDFVPSPTPNDIDPITSNQFAILDQLESIADPTLEEFVFLNELLFLSPDEQLFALDILSASQYTTFAIDAEIINRKFIRRLYDPLRKMLEKPPCACTCTRSLFDTWVDIGYDKARVHTTNCIEGFEWDGYDVTIGGEMRKSPCFTLGAAVSYERDKIDFDLCGKGTIESFLGGIYGLYRPECYYILGDFVVGYNKGHVTRDINIGTFHSRARGTPKFLQGTLYLEAGADMYSCECWNKYLFQPFIGIESGYGHFNRIQDTGTNPLFNVTVASRRYWNTTGRVGLHFFTTICTLSVAADLAWQHRLTSQKNRGKEHFQEFGEEFSIHGGCLSRDSIDAAFNLAALVASDFRIYIEGAGQWWNNAYMYNIFGGFQIGW